jgi:hypothetical protein
MKVAGSALFLAAILGSASPATAGHPQERRGFWIGFGVGYGSADATCDGCEGDGGSNREGSVTGFVKLGGTLSQRVLLGVETNLWVKSEAGLTLTLSSFTGTVSFYPHASSGFFVKGGVGLSHVNTEFNDASSTVSLGKTGWGVLAGLGYDLRVGRNVSLTPCFNYFYGRPGDLSWGGDTLAGRWRQNVIDFALGITFH